MKKFLKNLFSYSPVYGGMIITITLKSLYRDFIGEEAYIHQVQQSHLDNEMLTIPFGIIILTLGIIWTIERKPPTK